MPTPTPTPELDARLAAAPDLIDRIFDFILEHHPALSAAIVAQAKKAARHEFGGQEIYIPLHPANDRQALVAQVLALFNGRNATEVARKLGIHRATVYRILKQPRRPGLQKLSQLSGTRDTPRG